MLLLQCSVCWASWQLSKWFLTSSAHTGTSVFNELLKLMEPEFQGTRLRPGELLEKAIRLKPTGPRLRTQQEIQKESAPVDHKVALHRHRNENQCTFQK